MPSFHDTATSAAPPEEVWKLLYDPSRFPDWWAGIGTVERRRATASTPCTRTATPTSRWRSCSTPPGPSSASRVSCLVSDLRFEWRLEPDGDGTLITVDVEIPDAEAHRLDTQREVISASMLRLAALAADPSRIITRDGCCVWRSHTGRVRRRADLVPVAVRAAAGARVYLGGRRCAAGAGRARAG